MHVALPPNRFAHIEIVNVFRPGAGDLITFPSSNFAASECRINRKAANFAHYLSNQQHDMRIPLVADYNGSFVNVSLQFVDVEQGIVKFYAPVFPEVAYRLAEPVRDYVSAFESAIGRDGTMLCSRAIAS